MHELAVVQDAHHFRIADFLAAGIESRRAELDVEGLPFPGGLLALTRGEWPSTFCSLIQRG